MRRVFNLINQTCRIAARLISDSAERPLSRLERIGLSIHLVGCRSCRRYRQQLRMLDLAAKPATDESDAVKLSTAARRRISLRLADVPGHHDA